MEFSVLSAKEEDFQSIYDIFLPIIEEGESFIYDLDSSSLEEIHKIWMENTFPYVVKKNDGTIVASYVIRVNKVGRGSHVCNAGYIVHKDYQGIGIGRLIGEHSLKEAKNLGFKSMQFNVVVSTNSRSISLWKSIGFNIIGTVPKAFNHAKKNLVDIYIMHRFLD